MIMKNTPMAKIHFLFIMLGLTQINVIDEGKIKGVITIQEFLQKSRKIPLNPNINSYIRSNITSTSPNR